MARIRSVKPEFHQDEDICELGFETRQAYIGLMNYADREGKFEWRPKYLQMMIFPPYGKVNRKVSMDKQLEILKNAAKKGSKRPFIIQYSDPETGKIYGKILTFLKHQRPHPNEPKSELPDPPKIVKDNQCNTQDNQCKTLVIHENDLVMGREGKGKEGKGHGQGTAAPTPAGGPPSDPTADWPHYMKRNLKEATRGRG